MRRLKLTRLQTFYVRQRIVSRDNEGVQIVSWGPAIELKGEVWPANDRRSIESYGDRITGIQSVWLQGQYMLTFESGVSKVLLRGPNYLLSLGDGICFEAGPEDEPDYQVLSFTPYDLLKLEIERR